MNDNQADAIRDTIIEMEIVNNLAVTSLPVVDNNMTSLNINNNEMQMLHRPQRRCSSASPELRAPKDEMIFGSVSGGPLSSISNPTIPTTTPTMANEAVAAAVAEAKTGPTTPVLNKPLPPTNNNYINKSNNMKCMDNECVSVLAKTNNVMRNVTASTNNSNSNTETANNVEMILDSRPGPSRYCTGKQQQHAYISVDALAPIPENPSEESDSLHSAESLTCRICHNSEHPERLVSPCLCKGTLTYVHLHCLEHWISLSHCTTCELCQFRYNTRQTLRYSLLQSLRMWYSRSVSRRALQEDCQMFSLLTLVAFGIIGTLLVAVQYYIVQGHMGTLSRLWTKGWLLFFLLTTLVVYFVNVYMIIKSQLSPWYRWWQSARDIHLVLENRRPSCHNPINLKTNRKKMSSASAQATRAMSEQQNNPEVSNNVPSNNQTSSSQPTQVTPAAASVVQSSTTAPTQVTSAAITTEV